MNSAANQVIKPEMDDTSTISIKKIISDADSTYKGAPATTHKFEIRRAALTTPKKTTVSTVQKGESKRDVKLISEILTCL